MNEERDTDPELAGMIARREMPEGAPQVREAVLREAAGRSKPAPATRTPIVALFAAAGLAAAACVALIALSDGGPVAPNPTPRAVPAVVTTTPDDDAGERLDDLRDRIDRMRAPSQPSGLAMPPPGELLKRARRLRIEIADATMTTPKETNP